jgi:hypothetical protein
MTDLLLRGGWEHDRRRCSYYAIARCLGAFLDATRAVDIYFLLQKMVSVVSYTKKGARQMQTKARHFHHSVYSTPPSPNRAKGSFTLVRNSIDCTRGVAFRPATTLYRGKMRPPTGESRVLICQY